MSSYYNLKNKNSSTMDEHEILTKTQSLIAAKREARRLRILQNSNNRLEKITGRAQNDEIRDILNDIPQTNIIYEDPELERDTYERPNINQNDPNNINANMFNLLNSLSQQPGSSQQNGNPFINFAQFAEGDMNSFGGASQSPRVTHQPTSLFVKILNTKIHIVLVSIIVYSLFATGNQNYSSNNVFLYLLLWELAEVFLLKTYKNSNNSLGGIVLLLTGISAQYTTAFFKIFNTFNKILKDVAIFVFIFVVTHILWEYFGKERTIIDIIGTVKL